ncbi:hypothetical protein CmeUKMEL1_10380 [Cryptosporidium meleagridis]|uniref:Integral membrane protein n=1 Tax=Cryptosporidium meleagridis TaxID=93969 RepID=A0A2P4Z1U7_9CRYT|nr:hypothetical protein CmeUKMEL1_10380 [Cryptosporidium meleagridis]
MRRSILIPLVQILIFVVFSDSTNALSLKAGAQGPIDSDSDSDNERKRAPSHPTLRQVAENLRKKKKKEKSRSKLNSIFII